MKRRILVFFIFLGIFALAYSIGAESTISNEDAKAFVKEFQQEVQGIDAIGIFFHNATVALPMFVPGFGIAWGSFAAWSTGLAFHALVAENPILEKIPPLAVLFISPFGVMELAAYSISMSRSFIVVWSIIKRKPIKKEVRPTIIEIGIVVALLLAGGFIESSLITQFGSSITH